MIALKFKRVDYGFLGITNIGKTFFLDLTT